METKLELYQKVTPLANLGVWERNLLTGDIYWNGTVREIYEVDQNYSPSHETIVDFYLDKAGIEKFVADAVGSCHQNTAKFQIRTAKGRFKWVKVRISSDYQDDKCTSLYGTIEDITEQVGLADTLAERDEQFHQAFESAPIGMALVSVEGEWLRVNKVLCQMLGREKQEFMRTTFQEITFPDDLELDVAQMNDLLQGKIAFYHLEKRYIRKNGNTIWTALHVTLVRTTDGNPLYFISQIKDISERKAMEMERIKTLEVITKQNERLLNFAHIVSHNLCSHTGNISMLTDIISTETDPEEKANMINMLKINAANLQETLVHLNDVVNVQVYEKFNKKRLNLSREIARTLEILSESIKQVGAKITIHQDKEVQINYDPAYLESILLNLLTNSIKYRNPDRTLMLTMRIEDQQGRIKFSVQDNGLGIDLVMHGHKLFGMYKTFHGNEDARGIGLFLVKSQVEAMGGNCLARL